MLRAVRRCPSGITREVFDGFCSQMNEGYRDGSFLKLSNSDWIYGEKIGRLHQYLILMLSKGSAAKSRFYDQNGFETWRRLHKAIGPVHPEEGRQIITRMTSLFARPSPSTEDLWKNIMAQHKLNAEPVDKRGKYAPEADLTSNVWFGLAAEFAREAARA